MEHPAADHVAKLVDLTKKLPQEEDTVDIVFFPDFYVGFINSDVQAFCKGKAFVLRVNDDIEPFYFGSKPLKPGRKGDKARVFSMFSDGSFLHFPMPQGVMANLLKVLEKEKFDGVFDCCCFAQFLKYGSYKHSSDAQDLWEKVEKVTHEDEIRPGESAALLSANGLRVCHYAIYLGSGFYISKLGVSGPLAIMTLAEMRNFYLMSQGGSFARMVPFDDGLK